MKIKKIIYVFTVLLFYSIGASAQTKKPNIILIMADDLSYYDIEPYGSKQVQTPNITALANAGVCLDNMFTSTSVCAPTRMQIMTGIYPVRNGGYPNHSRVYEGTKSVAHYMQQLGYQTALIGKTHYAPLSAFPFKFLGGRVSDRGEGRDIELEKAEDFILQSKGKPYLLLVTSNQPHSPYTRGNAALYPPDKITVNPGMVDTEVTRDQLSKYYAEVTYLDSLVGRCLDIVQKSGEADNTVVIFTSEHGAGIPFSKYSCYDTGLKTAFIVKWPDKIKPQSRNNALTQYVDVVPTLIDIAGGDPTKFDTGNKDAYGFTGFDGKSFKEVLFEKTNHFRDFVFGVQTTRGIIEGSENYPIRSARDNKYLYIHNLNYQTEYSNGSIRGALFQSWIKKDPARTSFYINRPEEELYDVRKDPFQLHNLAKSTSLNGVKKKMKTALSTFMHQQGDEGIDTEWKAYERMPSKEKK